MRIIENEAVLNLIERRIVGGGKRQAIGAVPCIAAVQRLEGRRQQLDEYISNDPTTNVMLGVERAIVDAQIDHVAGMAARLCLHQMGIPSELAKEPTYPQPAENEL